MNVNDPNKTGPDFFYSPEKCGTTLQYRNVSIVNCTLRNFEQTVVMDESNTDLLLHRFKISVTGWVTHEILEGLGIFVNEDASIPKRWPAETMELLKKYLMHPRYRLILWIENQILLQVLGYENLGYATNPGADPNGRRRMPTGSVAKGKVTKEPDFDTLALFDVENGPIPESCRVTYVTGAKAFFVEFDIRASVVGCNQEEISKNPKAGQNVHRRKDAPDGAGYNHAILNNRWQIEETRDADFMISRTFTGKLVARSYAHSMLGDQTAYYRYLVIPRLLRGFKREKMTFVQSRTGLELNYTVVDVQRYAAPPLPAIDWAATHTESVNALTGATGESSVSVWLKGAPNVKKRDLFIAAVRVVEHRLANMRGKAAQTKMIPVDFKMTDSMHLPELKLEVTARRVVETGGFPSTTYAGVIIDTLGTLPAVNSLMPDEPKLPNGKPEPNNLDRDEKVTNQWCRDKWPTPIPFNGSAPVGHFITYLQNPCFGYHGIPNESDLVPDDSEETENLSSNVYNDPDELNILVFEGDQEQIAFLDSQIIKPDENVFSLAHLNNLYTHYEIESKYVTSQGLSAAPLATPAGSSQNQLAIIRVSHPVTYRDVWVRGKRAGALPETPVAPEINQDENGIIERLVYSEIVPLPPQLTANRTDMEYEIEVFYRYALLRSPGSSDKLRAGSMPWDISTASTNSFSIETTQNGTII